MNEYVIKYVNEHVNDFINEYVVEYVMFKNIYYVTDNEITSKNDKKNENQSSTIFNFNAETNSASFSVIQSPFLYRLVQLCNLYHYMRDMLILMER